MKYIITSIALVFMGQIAIAQNYDELKILYADGDYKKLVAKAVKITESDKRKKEVPPYLWAAKGLYKISISGDTDEKYKNSYKDAIKYLGKGMKLDFKYNEGGTLTETEFEEFVPEFQMTLYHRINNELEAESYKKAYSWAVKYQKISGNLVGMKYLAGACKYLDKDPGTSRVLWLEGKKLMDETTSIDDWSEADQTIFMMGIIQTSKALIGSRQTEKAKKLADQAAQWFEEEDTWKEFYAASF